MKPFVNSQTQIYKFFEFIASNRIDYLKIISFFAQRHPAYLKIEIYKKKKCKITKNICAK